MQLSALTCVIAMWCSFGTVFVTAMIMIPSSADAQKVSRGTTRGGVRGGGNAGRRGGRGLGGKSKRNQRELQTMDICAQTLTEDVALTQDYECDYYGPDLAQGVTLDCQGHKIALKAKGSSGKAAGVMLGYDYSCDSTDGSSCTTSDNITVKNCIFDGFGRGAMVSREARNTLIENVQFTNMENAAVRVYGQHTTLKNVIISETQHGNGLNFYETADHVTLDGVTSCYNAGADVDFVAGSNDNGDPPINVQYGNGQVVYCDNCPDIATTQKQPCGAHPTLTQSPTVAPSSAPTTARDTYCSSSDQVGKTLKSWYFGHHNGGSGLWSQCETLCRLDSRCNSWMGRNSGNTCYLSIDAELKDKPLGCCHDHHPHTFNAENCQT